MALIKFSCMECYILHVCIIIERACYMNTNYNINSKDLGSISMKVALDVNPNPYQTTSTGLTTTPPALESSQQSQLVTTIQSQGLVSLPGNPMDSAFTASSEQPLACAETEASSKENRGRWTDEEQKLFLEAYQKHGKNWKEIHSHVKTRTSNQARSHAQKYFSKLRKAQLKAGALCPACNHPVKIAQDESEQVVTQSSTPFVSPFARDKEEEKRPNFKVSRLLFQDNDDEDLEPVKKTKLTTTSALCQHSQRNNPHRFITRVSTQDPIISNIVNRKNSLEALVLQEPGLKELNQDMLEHEPPKPLGVTIIELNPDIQNAFDECEVLEPAAFPEDIMPQTID